MSAIQSLAGYVNEQIIEMKKKIPEADGLCKFNQISDNNFFELDIDSFLFTFWKIEGGFEINDEMQSGF